VVRIYHPKIEIRLIKVATHSAAPIGEISRNADNKTKTPYRAASTAEPEIDLVPFLADGSSVRIVNGVHEPAGAWAITVVDGPHETRRVGSRVESLSNLIELGDLIEFRLAHSPHEYAGRKLPIVMRGQVSEIRRRRGIDGQGRPQRQVVISGQNLIGRTWQALRIFYINGTPLGDNILTTFRFLQKYDATGTIARNPSVTDFMNDIVFQLISQFLGTMTWANRKALGLEFSTVNIECTARGKVHGMLASSFEGGSLYRFIAMLCDVDSGLNELFGESREDGEAIILRPVPWRDLQGKFIQPGVPDIETFEISDDDIISIESARTDQNVSNFVRVRSRPWVLNSDSAFMMSNAITDQTGYPYYSPEIYGFRLLDAEISLGAPDYTGPADRRNAEQRTAYAVSENEWVKTQRESLALALAHRDSALFERGTLTVRGNERLRAVTFVRVAEGDLTYTVYVARVEHRFDPFRGFTTTVNFERSDSFVQPITRGDIAVSG